MPHHLTQPSHWRHPLTRRSLLRGTGAALALPWLEAMTQTKARASERDDGSTSDAPIRMAALFVPNGVRQDQWTPKETGRDYELSPTLQPLEKLKDQLLVLTNLWNQGSNIGD
ncbi:MAG: DUF1552 domain-containing protein, partial [Rubripirellula sp.]